MFVRILLSLIVIGMLGVAGIVTAEVLRRKRVIHNEEARKMVHVLHALTIVAWAYFLPNYTPIIIVEVLFIILVVAVKRYGLLSGFRAVGRLTYGEVLFLLGVIAVCLLSPRYSHFVVIMLHVGIADAAAAVVGKRLKSPIYTVLGHTKSLAGSVACFVSSVAIFSSYLLYTNNISWSNLVFIAGGALIITGVENFSPYGSDNFTLPLAAYGLLLLMNM